MIKRIKITSRAEKDLEETEKFYVHLYGKKKTLLIIEAIYDTMYMLENDQVNLAKNRLY